MGSVPAYICSGCVHGSARNLSKSDKKNTWLLHVAQRRQRQERKKRAISEMHETVVARLSMITNLVHRESCLLS